MEHQLRVGIDLGGTKMLAIAISSDRQHRWQIATGKDFTATDAETAISQFIDTLPVPAHSIGIAIPGLVGDGIVIACDVLPKLVGWQPALAFTSIRHINVLNDAEAALHQVVQDLQPQTVAAVVMVGTGIGAAIYVNGQVLRGARGWAGEFGSIPIGIEGMALDLQSSGAAILQQLDIDAVQLSNLVTAGDPKALQSIERAGSIFGRGLAILINLLNPEAIVLAGGTLRWQGYLDAAIVSAKHYTLPDLWTSCRIQVSHQGEDLVALGAALRSLPNSI
jgi:glucokinase